MLLLFRQSQVSDVVVKTLTETTETLGLGKVHIEKKRKELGLH